MKLGFSVCFLFHGPLTGTLRWNGLEPELGGSRYFSGLVLLSMPSTSGMLLPPCPCKSISWYLLKMAVLFARCTWNCLLKVEEEKSLVKLRLFLSFVQIPFTIFSFIRSQNINHVLFTVAVYFKYVCLTLHYYNDTFIIPLYSSISVYEERN